MPSASHTEPASSRLWELEAQVRQYAESIRLDFDSSLEARYQLHQRRARLMWLQGGLLLSMSLLGGFLIVDGLWLHHYPLNVFLACSLLLLPLFVFALFTTRIHRLQSWAVTSACIVMAAAGLVVAWAPVQVAGALDQPPYMFGSCLIFIPFAYFFSGSSFRIDAAIAAAFSLVCLAFQAESGRTPEVILTSTYLLAAINCVGAVGRYILERTRRHDFLAQLLVRELAEHDTLTGLYNRRMFRANLEQRLDVAGPGQPALTLLLLDIDHFKQVNDTGGHAFGDAILHETGIALAEALQAPSDFAARLGGDEFGLVWTGLDPAASRSAAEALQARLVARYRHCVSRWNDESLVIGVNTSIGIVTDTPQPPVETVASLMHRADVALYAAKHAGRGRIVSA